MAQKILIFKIFLFILFFNNITIAKNIIGIPNIIDGDTIHINKNKIRLHGIDAPEIKQKCILNDKEWYCGKQSRIELKKLINNEIVECIVNNIDIYNRYIAICYVKKNNLNQLMVKKGWAIAYKHYSSQYIIEEKYAQENKLGIWAGKFVDPYIFRKMNK